MMMPTAIQASSSYELKLNTGEQVIATVEVLDPAKPSQWIGMAGISFDNIRKWLDQACIAHMARLEGNETVLEDLGNNIRVTIKPKGDDNASNQGESSV